MKPPPGALVRARRRVLEVVAPQVHYSLKRRFWNRAWARPDVPSPRSFWYLPPGVVPPQVVAAVESGWFPSGGRIADIGCGDGRIAAYLAGAGYEVEGIDFAAPAVARARAAFGESKTLRFQVLDISESVPDGPPFDALFDRGCYHGLPARLQMAYVRNTAACTRPGGRLLLMAKVTNDMRVDADTATALVARTVHDVRARFAPSFAIERTETVWFNSRGDDDRAESLPGVVFWMARC